MLLRALAIAWAIIGIGAGPAAAGEADKRPANVILASIIDSKLDAENGDLIRQAYGALGITVEYVKLPPRRSLEDGNSGRADGLVLRVAHTEDQYGNLLRVPVALAWLYGYAYTLRDFDLDRLDNAEKLRIGIRHGSQWSEKYTSGYPHVIREENEKVLLQKLLNGGIDVALGIDTNFLTEVRKLGVQDRIVAAREIARYPLFHYIHVRHAHLKEPLALELTRLMAARTNLQPAGAAPPGQAIDPQKLNGVESVSD